MTLAPHPSLPWRSRMSRPICQYSSTSSRLTESAALTWTVRMRSLSSVRKTG